MLKEHSLRRALAEELHARPATALTAPLRISHLSNFSGEGKAGEDRAHLEELCRHFKVSPPASDATHFKADFGRFWLRWERHTEFSSYNISHEGDFDQPFKKTLVEELPADWLGGFAGGVLAAMHLAVLPPGSPEPDAEALARLFDSNPMTASIIAAGRAKLYTDFRVHSDGFHRFLLHGSELSDATMGRVVQRLIEIEDYRMMAMLAFPIAKENRPRVTQAEKDLRGIIAQFKDAESDDSQLVLLEKLFELAAETEAINVATTYRFSAARAYAALIQDRITALREERISGFPRSMDFLQRRLDPAMETCENLAMRLESLSSRINRASSLLRTRVNVALEAQNRDLLNSMNQRANLQVRLQETVEGLSVVAISYYLLSLISYLGKGAKEAGLWSVEPYVLVSAAFPFVVGGIFIGVRRIRKVIKKANGSP